MIGGVFFALVLAGCRLDALRGTAEASDAPPAAEAHDDSSTTSLAEQLEAEKAEIAERAAQLDERAADLASEREALAARERDVRRREQQVGRRFDEIEARVRELETPAPVAPAPTPVAEPAPAEPPVVVTRRPVEPTTFRLTVPEGTSIAVELLDPLSSRDSRPGDTFRAAVSGDVLIDAEVAIPAGSTVFGEVVDAVPGKRIGGQSKLVLAFTGLEPRGGRSTAIEAQFALAGRKTTKKDAAIIGGAAAGGAILGRILDGDDDGGILGAVIGAAAGTAAAARDRDDVVLDAGTAFELYLTRAVHVVRGES
jgi:hypothetical protein